MKWSYGITTVPARLTTTLPRTIESLRLAGFDRPRLFIDGPSCGFERFPGLEITERDPPIKTWGNWLLTLIEMYLRQSDSDRYAVFQDDMVTYRNLREYLEKIPYPYNGYCNLYTFPQNDRISPKQIGWFYSNQCGLGAVATVITNEGASLFLSEPCVWQKSKNSDFKRATRSVDGCIVTAFNKIGWREYCHNPSLVQHIDTERSVAGNLPHPLSPSFRGESFDALNLLAELSIENIKTASADRFVGRWMILDDHSVAMRLQVNADGTAEREHVKGVIGSWRIDANRCLIEWPDGFRDELRAVNDGTCRLIAYIHGSVDWSDRPRRDDRAVRTR
jgi:hypothetical protein